MQQSPTTTEQSRLTRKRPFEEITPMVAFGEPSIVEPVAKLTKVGPRTTDIEECAYQLAVCRQMLQQEQQRRVEHLKIALAALRDIYMQIEGADIQTAQSLIDQLATYFEVPFTLASS